MPLSWMDEIRTAAEAKPWCRLHFIPTQCTRILECHCIVIQNIQRYTNLQCVSVIQVVH